RRARWIETVRDGDHSFGLQNPRTMSNFRVGQKVVCVHPGRAGDLPVGKIVTLTDVHVCPCCGEAAVAFRMDGKRYHCDRNTDRPIGPEWCFPHRFRPLDSLSAELAQAEVSRLV